MKTAFLILASIIALASCASPTPQYITTCAEPACNIMATNIENPYQPSEGMPFVISALLQINLAHPVIKIIHQNDTLILFLNDKTRIATSPISIDSLELNDSGVTTTHFMEWVFLKDFKTLEAEKRSADLLASVRQWKLSSSEYMTPTYFKNNQFKAFYYLTDTDHYQMIVLNNNNQDAAILIDLYNFTEENFKHFISTLDSYKK